MSETETSGKPAGSLVFTDGNEIVKQGVGASVNLVVGDLVTFDSNGFIIKATDTVGNQATGLGVALTSANNTAGADGDLSAQIALGNTYVYAVMGGAVPPFALVKADANNKLVIQAYPANAATPSNAEVDAVRDFLGKSFGRYWGHEKEESNPTAAADTEIGAIRLGAS